MIEFKKDLKLEFPGLLVKYNDAMSRLFPGSSIIIRFLDKEKAYYTHPYKVTSKISLGQKTYNNIIINFLCAEENCELCSNDYVIKKRYCFPILNRDDGKIQILDLNKSEYDSFDKYCKLKKINKIHEDNYSLLANVLTGGATIIKEDSTSDLSMTEIQQIMSLNSYWLDEYLEEFPTFSDAKVSVDTKKIWLPDGSWALRCSQCNFESQWAESNQDDGSFICARCRILSS